MDIAIFALGTAPARGSSSGGGESGVTGILKNGKLGTEGLLGTAVRDLVKVFAGGGGRGLLGVFAALGVRHRSRPPDYAAPGIHGHDRSPQHGCCDGLLPGWRGTDERVGADDGWEEVRPMKLFRRLAVSAYLRECLVLAATMAKWPYLLALPGSLWFFIAASSWQEQVRFGGAALIAALLPYHGDLLPLSRVSAQNFPSREPVTDSSASSAHAKR